MIAAIRFTVELHYLWLLLCLGTGFLSYWGVPGMGLASVLFLWFFVYRLNVEDKSQGTWSFFHSLPISFYERVLLRVGLPLVLSITVAALASRQLNPVLLYVRDDFRWDILSGCLLVLASLVARLLMGYLLVYFGLVLVASSLRFVGSVDFVLVVAALGACLYYLSEKRLNGKVLLAGTLCMMLPAWLLTAAFDRPLLSHMLRSKADKLQMEAAVWLAVRENDDEARKFFESKLKVVTDVEHLKTLLASLDRSRRPLSLTAQDWRDIGVRVPDGKGFILSYLMDRGADYPWWSAEAMESWEPLVLTGKSDCEDSCELLADILVSNRGEDFDYERLSTYLLPQASGDQVSYALKILESSEKPVLQKEIKALKAHPSSEIRERAETIAEGWH